MLKMYDLLNCNVSSKVETDDGVYCIIGQTTDKVVHFCDITKAPHIVVGGCTGSGKSVLLHSIILSLITKYSPDKVGLVLLDLKGTEFGLYCDLPHVLYEDNDSNVSLRALSVELARRKRLFTKENQPFTQRVVVIIDEYSLLDKEAQKIVKRLVRLGHGMGIHVILASQRVTRAYVPTDIRIYAETMVACRVATKADSYYLLGEHGAETLQGYGDIFYRDRSGERIRLTSGYASGKDIQAIVEIVKEKYKGRV